MKRSVGLARLGQKKVKVNKGGLSPVIASVLMILLVLVLAAIIFLWARGFLSEQIEKFGFPIEDQCSSIDFRAERVGSNLEVVNKGDTHIRHLDIKVFDEFGNSKIERFDFQIDAGESVSEPIAISDTDGDRVVVYPALIGNVRGKNSNKVFTCLDVGVEL